MLHRVIAIKNVGRFRNSVARPNPAFAKNTLVFAANGYGKTTFCAVMRSVQSGDAAPVIGRQTLGVGEAANIDLLFADGNRRLQNGDWSSPAANISVFDGVFVAENVHSGDVVDVVHRRNLYRVIIGRAGVGLAEREQALAEQSRAKQGELTAAERAVQALAPQGMALADFLSLPADPEIDAKITAQRQVLEALRQADEIARRTPLEPLPVPAISDDFQGVLAKSLEGIEADAVARLAGHLERHHMHDHGEQWIGEGVGYIAADECPFCGRDGIDGVPLVRAYRAVFSDQYRDSQAEIEAHRTGIANQIGDRAIDQLRVQLARNAAGIEFWARYCRINRDEFPDFEESLARVREAHQLLAGLIERKAQAPLEPIADHPEFGRAAQVLEAARTAFARYNEAVTAANRLIEARKQATAAGDLVAAAAALNRLEAVRQRHEPGAVQACSRYQQLDGEKRALEAAKDEVRDQLEAHTQQVVQPFEDRINDLLDLFNAGFRIVRTRHGYPGGIATSTYQLLINDTAVDLGDSRTPADRPSFKNTLSAGDRTTVALSFFLAQLESEPDLAERVVVFDDPFSSHDAFRRRQTIYEIMRVAGTCAQVIVLSHDALFLKQLWDKCPANDRAALQVIYHPAHGSKLGAFDLEDACRGRAAAELNDLMAFRSRGDGEPREIIKKLRVVVETHMRSTFPGAFLPDDNLGAILTKIRDGGEQHPARAMYDSIDRINDYTAEYHHGEDPRDAPEPLLDATELRGFVNNALQLVNALPA